MSALTNATALEELDLGDNQIVDLSPISAHANLRALRVPRNGIADVTALAGAAALQLLDLSDNRVRNLSALSSLGIEDLRIDNNSPPLSSSDIPSLTSIRRLSFYRNQIADISFLADLSGLEAVFLGANEIADVAALSNLEDLMHVDLGGNRVTDIRPLIGNSRLKRVNLRSNPLSEMSINVADDLRQRGVDIELGIVADGGDFPSSPITGIVNDNLVTMLFQGHSGANGHIEYYTFEFLRWFKDEFDYLVLVGGLGCGWRGAAVGLYVPVSSSIYGLGSRPFYDSRYGSGGKLKGTIWLCHPAGLSGGILQHELMHSWGAYLKYSEPEITRGVYGDAKGYFGAWGAHWGWSSANGILGGFDRDRMIDLGSDRYVLPGVNLVHGGRVPFSPIELYLAGYISPEEVPDLLVGKGVRDQGRRKFEQVVAVDDFVAIPIDQIIAENGERRPDWRRAQHDFRIATIAIDDWLDHSPREGWEELSQIVANFSWPDNDDSPLINFFEATGGRGTVTADGLSEFLKETARSEILPPSSGSFPAIKFCRHPMRVR